MPGDYRLQVRPSADVARGIAGLAVVAAIAAIAFAVPVWNFWLPLTFAAVATGVIHALPANSGTAPRIASAVSISALMLASWLWAELVASKVPDPFGFAHAFLVTSGVIAFAATAFLIVLRRVGTAILFGLCSLVGFLSSSAGGASRMLEWLVRVAGFTRSTAEAMIPWIRKSIHFSFYGTVALVAAHVAFTGGRRDSSRFLTGIGFALALACFDEYRQSGAAGRSGSVWDVLLDLCGAVVFSFVAKLLVARRRPAA